MLRPEIFVLLAALLLPLAGYRLLRRIREAQQREVEERYQRLYEDMLVGVDREVRDEILREDAATHRNDT